MICEMGRTLYQELQQAIIVSRYTDYSLPLEAYRQHNARCGVCREALGLDKKIVRLNVTDELRGTTSTDSVLDDRARSGSGGSLGAARQIELPGVRETAESHPY